MSKQVICSQADASCSQCSHGVPHTSCNSCSTNYCSDRDSAVGCKEIEIPEGKKIIKFIYLATPTAICDFINSEDVEVVAITLMGLFYKERD